MAKEILDIMAIPLNDGLYALVDGKNYKWLSKWKWSLARKKTNHLYAKRLARIKGKPKTIMMHREILGLRQGDKKMSDHINNCGLDNREQNLRICTNKQNQMNSKVRVDNKCGYKGVVRVGKKFRAIITSGGKQIHLGYFYKKEAAARAYDKAAIKLRGCFARTNCS